MLSALIGTIVTNLVGDAIKNKVTRRITPAGFEPAKGIVQSKTMWGTFIAAISPFLASWIGLEGHEMAETFQGLTLLVGVGMAWWGRKTASRKM